MMKAQSHPVRAFTLIELLVVISIIALLIALLMPALRRARMAAHQVACASNMHHVHVATIAYTMDHDGYVPAKTVLGNYSFRQAPGNVLKGDPRARPEFYGLAAVLDRGGYMEGRSDAWVCAGQPEWMQEYGNTYAFSIATLYEKRRYEELYHQKSKTHDFLWDNYTQYPGITGFNGPFGAGFTIPADKRVAPHPLASGETSESKDYGGGRNVLDISGFVRMHSER